MKPDTTQDRVFAFLESLTPNDTSALETKRIDTHANTVVLLGSRAYKVKRAVTFPFLDYSTLALRKEACEREITYNSRFSQNLYVEAVPVTEEEDGSLALDGSGEPIEWCGRHEPVFRR